MKYKVGDKVVYNNGVVQKCEVERVMGTEENPMALIQCSSDIFMVSQNDLSYYFPQHEATQKRTLGVQEMCEALQPATHKTLIIIGINKDMTNEECIEHAKAIEAHLGNEYRVLVLDEKVSEYEVVEDK